MNIYITEIYATPPEANEVCLWAGPNIPAESFDDAQNYCNSHGLGYCHVAGKLVDVVEDKESNICLN